MDSTPTRFEKAEGKLRNGLFLKGVGFYPDRVVFEVFTSRAVAKSELRTLALTDDLGTAYEAIPAEESVIEGHARLEFTPAPPVNWSRLRLTQPGWGLFITNDADSTPSQG